MTSSGAGTGDALPPIELAPEGSSRCSEIYDPHAANGRDFWTAETASIKVPVWRRRASGCYLVGSMERPWTGPPSHARFVARCVRAGELAGLDTAEPIPCWGSPSARAARLGEPAEVRSERGRGSGC